MGRSIAWLGTTTTWALVIFAQGILADEEKVSLDKVPKAVLEAVKLRFKDAKIIGAAKEIEDDKLVYEITIKQMGRNVDVTVTPAGAILMIEREIAARDLPRPVLKTLEEKYPKATYKLVEEIIKVDGKEEKLAYYEILLVTTQKRKLEVQLAPDGKIRNVEKRQPDNNGSNKPNESLSLAASVRADCS